MDRSNHNAEKVSLCLCNMYIFLTKRLAYRLLWIKYLPDQGSNLIVNFGTHSVVELDFVKKEFTAFRGDNTNTNCSQYLHKSAVFIQGWNKAQTILWKVWLSCLYFAKCSSNSIWCLFYWHQSNCQEIFLVFQVFILFELSN